MAASRVQESLWQASQLPVGSLLAAATTSLYSLALGAAASPFEQPTATATTTTNHHKQYGQLNYNPTTTPTSAPQLPGRPASFAGSALGGASYQLSSALAGSLEPPPNTRSHLNQHQHQYQHQHQHQHHYQHLNRHQNPLSSQLAASPSAASISDYWDQFEPQALIMQQQDASLSLDAAAAAAAAGQQQHQQQQLATSTTNDWWTDYWSRKPYPSEYALSSITFLSCLIGTIIILIVVGNLLVCIAIFTEKSLKPTQNWFIASLAVSDMLLGAVVMPFSLARELMGYWNFGEHWCDIHEAMDVLLTTASINTLCLISLDRYWSITQAVNYLKKRTPRRGALMIAFVWVFSAAVSLPPLFGWKKQSPGSQSTSNNKTTNNGFDATPSTTTTTLLESGAGDDDLEAPDSRGASDELSELGRPILDARQVKKRDYLLARLERQQDASPSSGKPRNRSLGARQAPWQDNQAASDGRPISAAQLAALGEPTVIVEVTTTKTLEQLQAIEYPQCQLSDDVGYVLYSALGSFYIPCAVMVFTYIKIFLAARSRARRTINKQSRSNAMIDKSAAAAGKRARAAAAAANQAAGKLACQQQQQQQQQLQATGAALAAAALSTTTSTACPNSANASETFYGNLVASGAPSDNAASQMTRGKVVIVERKKSLAGTTLAPLTIPSRGQTATTTAAIATSAELTTTTNDSEAKLISATPTETTSAADQPAEHRDLEVNNNNNNHDFSEQNKCTITTSGAHKASSSAFSGDCLLLVQPSMGSVPITRFNFKHVPATGASADLDPREREKRNAAKLLKAFSQLGADQQVVCDPLVGEIEAEAGNKPQQLGETGLPNIRLDETTTTTTLAEQVDSDCANKQQLSTNETCFMTIEEDSDMFDAQAGRTVMMVADTNAGQQQRRASVGPASASGHKSSHMVTMLARSQREQQVHCNNPVCSSYGGSSMTINDDDEYLHDDECDSIDDDDDDDCATDECNGYSCTLDHYGPDDDDDDDECPQCRLEMAAAGAGAAPAGAAEDSPARCSSSGHARYRPRPRRAPRRPRRRARRRQTLASGERDNLSLQDDDDDDADDDEEQEQEQDDDDDDDEEDSSSALGHDVLNATSAGAARCSPPGERRKSIVQALFSGGGAAGSAAGSGASANNNNNNNKLDKPAAGGQRKRSIINLRFGAMVGGCGATAGSGEISQQVPVALVGKNLTSDRAAGRQDKDDDDERAIRAPNLLALAAAQQQQVCSAPQASVRNLRQNFFLKLNQLAAKSAAMAAGGGGGDYKSKRQMSQSDRSSSQGRRGSLETSIDFGTISNVHSTDYQQETLMVDEYEPQNSVELHNSGHRFSSSGTASDHQSDNKQASAAAAAAAAAATTTSTSRKAMPPPTGATSANAAGCKQATASNDTNLLAGSDESYSVQSSAGNLLERRLESRLGVPNKLAIVSADLAGGNKQAQSGLAAINSNNNNNKKVTIGSPGSHANNRSSTIASSTGGASNAGGQPGGKRAYLPTDSERHKRKLAKARERRATLILGLIMAAFVTSWMPFFTFYVTRALCIVCRDYVPARLASFIFWMGYCNSAINPIIYTIFNRDFRKAFRRILFRWL